VTPRLKPDAKASWDIKLDEGGVEIMQGLRARMNDNGVSFLELHYSADPDKCSEEWLLHEQAGNPSANWDREYELAWRVAMGSAVYRGIFNPEVHIGTDLPFDKKRKLVVAWDFGRDPCCTFHQLTRDGRWFQIAECIAPERMAVESFMPYYFSFLDDRFGRLEKPPDHVADPAGWAAGVASEKGALEVLRSAGVFPFRGEKEYSKRLESVVWWLNQSPGGIPRYQIDRKWNPVTLEGFISGYQYPRIRGTEGLHHLPLKNEYSHPHDTVQYAAFAMFLNQRGELLEREMKSIPRRRKPGVFRRAGEQRRTA